MSSSSQRWSLLTRQPTRSGMRSLVLFTSVGAAVCFSFLQRLASKSWPSSQRRTAAQQFASQENCASLPPCGGKGKCLISQNQQQQKRNQTQKPTVPCHMIALFPFYTVSFLHLCDCKFQSPHYNCSTGSLPTVTMCYFLFVVISSSSPVGFSKGSDPR